MGCWPLPPPSKTEGRLASSLASASTEQDREAAGILAGLSLPRILDGLVALTALAVCAILFQAQAAHLVRGVLMDSLPDLSDSDADAYDLSKADVAGLMSK